MQATTVVLLSLLAVVLSGFAARIVQLPLPLVQIALGALIALSGLEAVTLDPQLFFLLFLPPLLFLDGWRIPNGALRRDAPSILRLALGLVVFTVLGMGLLIHALIPGMPLAVAFALAAVISPTDPIAVASIALRTPVPERLMHVLQGEALLNDASGLVCMRFAVAAALTGAFSLPQAVSGFVWLAGVGLAVGVGATVLVTRIVAWGTRRFGDDSDAQILVTLLIPFGVYLLAERLHGSGILAVVAAGVTMSASELWPWRADTRLRRTAVWDVVQTAANGSVFVLLGEQLPALVAAAPQTARAAGLPGAGWLVLDVVAIVAALLALRFVWVWVSLRLGFAGALRSAAPGAPRSSRVVWVMSLAGVRGAVTLAGVMTLPQLGGDGLPFPARDLAIVLAAGVIVLSLVLAWVALPTALRGLVLPSAESHRAAEDRTRRAAAAAAVLAVEAATATMTSGASNDAEVAAASARVVALYRERIDRTDPAQPVGTDDPVQRALRQVALQAERSEVLRAGPGEGLGQADVRRIVRELDLLAARHDV